jgi:hypothetical protein
MEKKPKYVRPSFGQACNAWEMLLRQRGFPAEVKWIFDENLCFEHATAAPNSFRLGFQTKFTPPPTDAEDIAYGHFTEFDAPLVFYRLGSSRGKSICLLLCDDWFSSKTENEGFTRRDDWGILFRAGPQEELEEITDEQRWKSRIVRDRPLHDLDFSMSLRAIHETLAHGRVLTSYERYALKLLHVWRRLLGEQK